MMTVTTLMALLAALFFMPSPQDLEPVAWRGTMRPPEGGELQVTFEVGGLTGEPLVLRLPGSGNPRRVVASDVRGEGTTLRFTLPLDTPTTCDLAASLAGGYDGTCVAGTGRKGQLSMVPPLAGMLHPLHERALALSAAPEEVSDPAAVYVLSPRGFVKVREGSNGVACLVERPTMGDLWPICYDPEGVARMLPVTLARAELRVKGLDEPAIAAQIADGYRTGRFQPAARAGVAYMLSASARSVNRETGEPATLTPHLMLYAPFVTAPDIGGNGALLGVMGSGRPDAYIIVRLPNYQPAPK